MRWFRYQRRKKKFPWRFRAASWLISTMTPWLRSSQELYFESVESLVRPKIRILDIGGGKAFLPEWLRPDLYRHWAKTIVDDVVIFSIDPHLPSLRQSTAHINVCAVAEQIPFLSSIFDLVTANMV